MRFVNSSGRRFRPAARDLLRVAHRIRCWQVAGDRISTAEDLMAELDILAGLHPGQARRVERMRSILINSLWESVVSIPEEVPA